jgi:hypothetical protein
LTIVWEQARQCCEEGSVGRSQPRPGRLAAEYREFLAQRE